MKNIHIISTDKPSRLYSYKSIDLYLHSEIVDANSANLNCKNQNIYITSDEEIKEGDWVFDNDANQAVAYKYLRVNPNLPNFPYYKKIILTDNKDLIKDGVQAIDDEFLEWFVKNPSCESVEVILYLKSITNPITNEDYPTVQYRHFDLNKMICKYEYKLIIPKEEVKQYSKYLSCCRSKEECYCKEEPKQETLEDACDRVLDYLYPNCKKEMSSLQYGNSINSLKSIAKWQQKQSYNEQEAFNMLMEFWKEERPEFKTNPVCVSNWFEQNKKK
jgi:hypothetical protein